MVDKKVWNQKMETLSREEVERVRLRRLRKQFKYCYTHSEFYRRKFDEAGFRPEEIKTWEDFRKIPPLMDKEDERQSQRESIERFGHPFGIHLCCPLEKIVVAKTTGGTTGLPTFSYSFTRNDYVRWDEGTARGYWLAGLRPGDRVLFCFPLSGGWAGSIVKTPLQYMGILCLDIGAETPVEKMEYGQGLEQSQLPDLAREIEERMFQSYRVRSKVEFVPPEALGRVTKKTPLFEEKYR